MPSWNCKSELKTVRISVDRKTKQVIEESKVPFFNLMVQHCINRWSVMASSIIDSLLKSFKPYISSPSDMKWLLQATYLPPYLNFRIWSRIFWFHWGSDQWIFSLILQVCSASSQTLQRSPVLSDSWSPGRWTSHIAHKRRRTSGIWESKSNPDSPGKEGFLKGICMSVRVMHLISMYLF